MSLITRLQRFIPGTRLIPRSLYTPLLLQIPLHISLLRRSRTRLLLLISSGSLRINTLSPRAGLAAVFRLLDNGIVDFVAELVDEPGARLVAGREGDFAFELAHLGFVEEIAVLVAEFDLLLRHAAVVYHLRLRGPAGRDDHVVLGVVGNGGCGPVGGLAGGGGPGAGRGGVERVFGVVVEEGVAVPVPGREELDRVAFGFRPHVAVGERGVEPEDDDAGAEEDDGGDAADARPVLQRERADADAGREEVEDLGEGDDGEVESREVVVQEELSVG